MTERRAQVERVKRGWEFDADVVGAFDEWTEEAGLQKNVAAQLGLWTVMHMGADDREYLLGHMRREQETGLAPGCFVASVFAAPELPKWSDDTILQLCHRRGWIRERAIAAAVLSFTHQDAPTQAEAYEQASNHWDQGPPFTDEEQAWVGDDEQQGATDRVRDPGQRNGSDPATASESADVAPAARGRDAADGEPSTSGSSKPAEGLADEIEASRPHRKKSGRGDSASA